MAGQRGQSWLGENNIWIAGLVFALCVTVGIVGCDQIAESFQEPPSDIELLYEDCEAAERADAKGEVDHDDEDDPQATLLADDRCVTHNAQMVAVEVAEDQAELREARAGVGEVTPPSTVPVEDTRDDGYTVLAVED